LAAALRSQPPQRWDRIVRGATRLVGRRAPAQPGDKLHKLAGSLSVSDRSAVWDSLTSCWSEPVVVDAAPVEPPLPAWSRSPVEWAMLADTISYLPDDLLVKVDRATMAVSLEARVPMLDPDVFAAAWQLPLDAKIRGSRGKRVLLDVLHRYVPSDLVDGPKTGFGVPFGDWLRGPLQPWATELLAPERLHAEGYFDAQLVTRRWREHLAGSHDHRHQLWAVLMFEAWLDTRESR
jgi:asparagine synthase (glutamine-hydrolysing)